VLSAVCILRVRASASGDIAASNSLAKAKSRDLHRLVGPDDHVGGFEITVDDAARMSAASAIAIRSALFRRIPDVG
jgi:hypothetical protein